VTKLSASAFSASDPSLLQTFEGQSVEGRPFLGERDVHVWLSSDAQFSTSDAFLRRVLSCYAAVNPLQWRFSRGEHGKPALKDAQADLDFNVSHSGDRLACAVTRGASVGVDLEHCHAERDVMRLARRFFGAEEVAALEDCAAALQSDRFYDYWTLKEAAVKCRGQTLVSGLDSRAFAVEFGSAAALDGRIAVISLGQADAASYCLLDPFPEYRLAVCCLPEIHRKAQIQIQLLELFYTGAITLLNAPLRASSSWE